MNPQEEKQFDEMWHSVYDFDLPETIKSHVSSLIATREREWLEKAKSVYVESNLISTNPESNEFAYESGNNNAVRKILALIQDKKQK